MASAYIIQTGGETAGIVVLERGGVRFYASEPTFGKLDGRRFRNVRAVRNAVTELRSVQRGSSEFPRSLAA